MKSNSIDAYDYSSRVVSYDREMEIMHPNRSKMIDIALEVLPLNSDSQFTALELGSGTGYFTKQFLEKFPKTTVIAVDGAASMVELAKERLRTFTDKVDFRVSDFRKLNDIMAPDEKVNVVFTSYALHHLNIKDKTEVIKTIIRILEPGGWFLNADLVMPESPEIRERIQNIRINGIIKRGKHIDKKYRDFESTGKFLQKLEAEEHDQPLTLLDDLKIMKKSGMRNVSVFWLEYRELVLGGQK